MKLIVAVLLLLSTSAWAEWTFVAAPSDKTFLGYADLATLRNRGNTVTMWRLLDYKSTQRPSNSRYLSMQIQYEYDCVNEQLRPIYFIAFAENMGNGEALFGEASVLLEWAPISPESVNAAYWKIACKA